MTAYQIFTPPCGNVVTSNSWMTESVNPVAFPAELTSTLTGASAYQLRRWRSTGLVVPEISEKRPPLYSFRDLVLLRTVVRLRGLTSIQKIRTALGNLSLFDLTDHPAEYRFGSDGSTVAVWTEDTFVDLVKHPGQMHLVSLAEIYEPFETERGELVVDFKRPRRHLEINARRLGGWPTIEGSRIGYDTIADLVAAGDVAPEDVSRFYPAVTPAAVADAVDFAESVRSRKLTRSA